ncbi:MAG: hypothetical protein AAF512_19885, partial [Pseudomonadota bacterium]
MLSNAELIVQAAAVVKTYKTQNGGLYGDVGCALISEDDKIYLGVCADVGSNVFCAEPNAIGSMMTEGGYHIKKIVAVWNRLWGSWPSAAAPPVSARFSIVAGSCGSSCWPVAAGS